MEKQRRRQIHASVWEDYITTIDTTENAELANAGTFSHKVEILIKKGLDAMGIEIKPKTK